MDLISLAKSRTPESLSKGSLFLTLLEIHAGIKEQAKQEVLYLKVFKDLDQAKGLQLDWLGLLLGLKRPKYTVVDDGIDQYFKYSFDAITGDSYSFDAVASKLYQIESKAFISMIDADYRIMLKAFAELSNFSGSRPEYNSFLKAVFGMSAFIFTDIYGDLSFIVEDTRNLTIDKPLFESIVPKIPTVKNSFSYSLGKVFRYSFDTLTGTAYNFDASEEYTYIL